MNKHTCSFVKGVVLPAAFLLIMAGNGCGAREGDEPTKYRSQEGLEKLTAQAQKPRDNPVFAAARNVTAKNTTAQDIDAIVRPVLARTFGDAKLIAAAGPEAPQRDGEVIEDRMAYVVRASMTESDGDRLHGAFRSAGFVTSPRLGSKPTHARGKVYMSLMRSTRMRGYSFVIVVDTRAQRIEVESYKLGSKYDRLM